MHTSGFPGSSDENLLEKEMATHSSILVSKIPGQRSLTGYNPWGHKELDKIERLTYIKKKKKYIYIYTHIIFHILFHYGLS